MKFYDIKVEAPDGSLVDMKDYEDYLSFKDVELTPEEPACCQQLYSILDGIVQKVITDKDVDIDAVIEEAVKDFKDGKPILIADDENRENEGDLICSAQMITPEIINFMAAECRGLICLAISQQIADKLELSQMVEHNTESLNTAFTQSYT